MELKVLTLNCWGLPYGFSKDKDKRMQCIGEELAKGRYDVVALQEIWRMSDFYMIQSMVKLVLPYSHYFASGFIGTGLCIFSKWPITDSLCSRYSLNGYAHKVMQMDWYASKMIAMCRIDMDGMVAMVYTTHTHALYAPSHIQKRDEFVAHRLVQLYEMSEFVRLTSARADVTIVMGDLNTEPHTLAAKLALANAGLLDAWETRQNVEYSDGNTNERLHNHYSMSQTLRYIKCYDGERIDYILYRSAPSHFIHCRQTKLDLQKRDAGMPPSDHEGVATIFEVTLTEDSEVNADDTMPNGNIQAAESDDKVTTASDKEILIEYLQEAISVLSDARVKSAADQQTSLKKAAFCFLVLLISSLFHPSAFVVHLLVLTWNSAITVLLVFYLCFAVSVKEGEMNTLAGSETNMKLRLAHVNHAIKI